MDVRADAFDSVQATRAKLTSRQVNLVHFALAMGGFAVGTTEFAAMSLLPYFAATFGSSEPNAGYAVSAYALGVVVGAPVIAVLAAKWSRRMLLLTLMTVFAVFNRIVVTGHRVWPFPSFHAGAAMPGPASRNGQV